VTTAFAIIEPWFGESHRALFSGISHHTALHCTLVTLPALKWRWRIRFGAYHMRYLVERLDPRPDALLVSDYLNLPLLRGFAPKIASIPTAVYFLENQLTYPTTGRHTRDFEYMAANVLTCLSSEKVVFCSMQQQAALLAAIPDFLKWDPSATPAQIVEEIAAKSTVIPIGVDLPLFDRARERRPNRQGAPLRIVWPHRLEHDKNPDDFFSVLLELHEEGHPFELTVLGRTYRDEPAIVQTARQRLAPHIATFEFLTGDSYAQALSASDVVVSTAWQETQGIAVIEAIRAGCDPLLPNRLSYPEILSPNLKQKHLYETKGELRRRLRWMMRHPDRVRHTSTDHWREMSRFGWDTVSPQFDKLIESLHQSGTQRAEQ
jgi:glycosyltransferase involved in cell wall biosynthesis